MAALELHYLIKELEQLIGAKVDKIYHPQKKELIINFYISGKGKQILRILSPSIMYLTDYKQEYPQTPSGFCIRLRKLLDNSRLIEINLLGFERIVEFVFQTKDAKLRLIFEMFSKGNIVICKEDYAIMSVLEVQRWSKRTVKPKVKYDYPKKEFNFLEIKEKDLQELMDKSKKDLVRTLATTLGLGGVYAEELCLMAKVDKEQKKLDEKETKKLDKASKLLIKKKIKAAVVYDKQEVKDIVPIELEFYRDFEKKQFKTYNLALDSVFTKRIVKQVKDQKLSKHQKNIEKLQKIISKQEEHVKKFEKDIEENTKKAELIFKNYQLVDNVLGLLGDISKKHPWKEIKDRLKGHKLIKEVNPKEKSIVLKLK